MFKFFRKFNIFKTLYRVEERRGLYQVYRYTLWDGGEHVHSTVELGDAREWIAKDKADRKITVVHEE